MVRRRDLLKASLSVSGCGTCGALGISMSGGSARADGPTATSGAGYELWFIGAQRETIMNGRLAAVLDLKTLAGRPHFYGLGPIEQLVMIADSRPALARVGSDGTVNVTGSFDAGVPFFVMGRGAAMDQDADPGGGPFLRRPRTLCSASSRNCRPRCETAVAVFGYRPGGCDRVPHPQPDRRPAT